MKKLLLILFAICPLFAFGQVTEAQKQEALAAASSFCSLLAQFSNGGVTHLSNDQKIFNLCSTPKISTFDDISQKEGMLNAYLALITKKYKNHLKMFFSEPTIKESYEIPSIEKTNNFVNDNSDLGYVGTILGKAGHSDIYIVMEVKQSLPSQKRETIRNIIYSIKERNIIAFSNKNSPFMTYCKALDAYLNTQYTQSLSYCDKTLSEERFDKKRDCAIVAILSCYNLKDYNRIYNYTKYLGEFQENIEWTARNLEAYTKNDDKALFESTSKLASFNWSIPQTKGDYQALLAFMYANGLGCEKSELKAIYYYNCAVKNESACAGYFMMMDNMSNNIEVDDDVLIPALKQSASKGYIPAYYLLAIIDANYGRTEQEGAWYKKGAEQGDPMGMIYYGCWLSAIKHDKQSALYWLKKATSNPNLSTYLENRMMKKDGMRTIEDIKQLVYKVENNIPIPPPVPINDPENSHQSTNTINSTSPSSASTSTATSSTSVSTSSSTTSYNRYKPRTNREFNMPFDEQGEFGISVGYVQKQWVAKADGETTKMGYWDDTKYMSGIQAGFRFEPLFKYGFGIDTGLYYEYYYSKSKTISYEGNEFEPSINEHSLYLPIHLEYRLNFSSKFQLFFYGGVGLDYVLSAKLKTNRDDLTYDEDDAYENSNLRKFNTSLEYGGGIRVYGVQLNFTLTNGLMNIYKESDANIKQQKNLMCSLSYMF